MKTLRFFSLLWLAAAGLLASCRRADDPNPAEPPGITGQVRVLSQQNQLQSAAGVTVTVADSNPTISATTGSDGRFSLPHLPAGSYDLLFARSGLSTFVLRGVPHPKADSTTQLPAYFPLAEEPTVQATDLTVEPASRPDLVQLRMTIRSPQVIASYTWVVYVGSTPAVSFLNTRPCLVLYGSSSPPGTTFTTTWTLDRADLQEGGYTFASGTKLYAVLHGAGQLQTQYTDPATGKKMTWQNVNMTPSPVVSFAMP